MIQTPQLISPCVSNCCLDDKDMCLGCFRMLDEILNWSQSDDPQRQQVLHNCEKRCEEYKKQHKHYFPS
ncbi:DUF1289 domain-containing protein [Paraglaciecola sp. L3A3]|uniref:DUF1289 domain-containing protein n=1 Tax=Paraglaciecola sp. L3A3 TaxID=2686358 RepID=UPI00131D81D0|nr:DUF1289 domain-containing protein [Paraglaciecola sp. L3A3]